MQNVDFLPQRYRQEQTVRKNRTWRLAVIALFGSAIMVAALWQLAERRSAQRQLTDVEPLLARAAAKEQQFARLQAELGDVRATAPLRAWLQHPWPTSRFLEAVAAPADEKIQLTELRLVRDTKDNRPELRAEATPGSAPASPEQIPAAQRDLALLYEKHASGEQTIELHGIADDATALHGYVARLTESALVAKAELLSMESAVPSAASGDAGPAVKQQGDGVQFVVRIWVAAAWPPPAPGKLSVNAHQSALGS